MKNPKISIITPSLNQGEFIQQAIESVLSQKYPNFEHIIIDGKSSDNTLDILKKYPHLKWVSQKDHNHIEAVNRGIQMATGKIMTILNSDDYFSLGAFHKAAKLFEKNKNNYFVCGNCRLVDIKGHFIRTSHPYTNKMDLLQPWKYEFPLNPSSYFYRRIIHQQIGFYSATIGPAYDYEFILRVVSNYPLTKTNFTFGNYRIHPNSITSKNKKNSMKETVNIAKKYFGPFTSTTYWQLTTHSVLDPITSYTIHLIGKLRTIFALRTRIRKLFSRVDS